MRSKVKAVTILLEMVKAYKRQDYPPKNSTKKTTHKHKHPHTHKRTNSTTSEPNTDQLTEGALEVKPRKERKSNPETVSLCCAICFHRIS